MKLEIKDDHIMFGRFLIRYEEFAGLLCAGRRIDPTTEEVEALSLEILKLARENQLSDKNAFEFVKKVCYWGGRSGWGLVFPQVKKYWISTNANHLERAANAVELIIEPSDEALSDELVRSSLKAAIGEILKIKGLAVSFASKVARFLDPVHSGVLDKVVGEELDVPVPVNVKNYLEYCSRLGRLASKLKEKGVINPLVQTAHWRAADIDLVLWTRASGHGPCDDNQIANMSSRGGQPPTLPALDNPLIGNDRARTCRCQRVCLDCLFAAALDLDDSTYRSDAKRVGEAVRDGFTNNKDGEVFPVNRDECVCDCSYGTEIEVGTFCYAKAKLGIKSPSAWRTGLREALELARTRNAQCESCARCNS
jgi:hypothetical protein